MLVDNRLHQPPDLAVAQLCLGLPFELRLWNLYGDYGHQSFSNVFRLYGLHVLCLRALGGERVDGPRQRGAESRQVGSTLLGADVVRIRVDRLRVGVVVLHRYVNGDAVLFRGEVDGLVQHVLVRVDHVDELDDAALEKEVVASILFPALVDDADM